MALTTACVVGYLVLLGLERLVALLDTFSGVYPMLLTAAPGAIPGFGYVPDNTPPAGPEGADPEVEGWKYLVATTLYVAPLGFRACSYSVPVEMSRACTPILAGSVGTPEHK